MEEFINWFRSSGGSVDTSVFGLTRFSEQGFGAIALRDIPEGHTLFTIPRSLILTLHTNELPELVGITTWSRFKLHKGWTGLILCMMWEEAGAVGGRSSGNSRWRTYLESLPSKFDTPMFWSKQEQEELKGSTVLDKIGKEQAERDYEEKIVPALDSRPDLFHPTVRSTAYSIERFHVMGSRILSRSFNVQPWEEKQGGQSESMDYGDHHGNESTEAGNNSAMDLDGSGVSDDSDDDDDAGAGAGAGDDDDDDNDNDDDDDDSDRPENVAMVPMADMLNARYGSENAKLFHEPSALKMITTKPIMKGDQIYNTYGDPPNADLLRKYGHVDLVLLHSLPSSSASTKVELGNPADVVEVPANLVTDIAKEWHMNKDPDVSDLEERIDWWLEEGGDDVFILDLEELLPPQFVSFSRLLLSPTHEWEKLREKGRPPKPKLDDMTGNVVKRVLEKRIGMYPTTIEEDTLLLETDLPLNRRNAIVVRLGEKRVLHEALLRLKKSRELEEREKVVPRTGKRRFDRDENTGSDSKRRK